MIDLYQAKGSKSMFSLMYMNESTTLRWIQVKVRTLLDGYPGTGD
jgi:hypothetical protein